MGTRALTIVKDLNDKEIIVMYTQFDGYIGGHGAELFEFLKDLVVTNGIRTSQPAKSANGMACLAAQIVEHFKDGVGGVYLHAPTNEPYNMCQEYTYTVFLKDDQLFLTANSEYKGDLWEGAVTSDNEDAFMTCDHDDEDEDEDEVVDELSRDEAIQKSISILKKAIAGNEEAETALEELEPLLED